MKNDYFIMGKNSLNEVLRRDSWRFIEIITHHEKSHAFLTPFLEKGIKITSMGRHTMEKILGSDSHGGFAARLERHENFSIGDMLDSLKEKKNATLVALDGILDPHNIGAILRSCECFGVDGVIWSKNRGPSITPVVTKVSVGASELVPICIVSNIHDALLKCQDDYFSIITAEKKANSCTHQDLPRQDKKVLVLGSEEKGVRALISKMADYSVFIPMQGQIDSLNVSAATAVLLSHLCTS